MRPQRHLLTQCLVHTVINKTTYIYFILLSSTIEQDLFENISKV